MCINKEQRHANERRHTVSNSSHFYGRQTYM